MKNVTSIVAAASILLLAPDAAAQDWPQWMGPSRDGSVAGFTAPAAWPAELTKSWSVSIGDGVATPALVGDRIYTFTRDETDEIIRCLNIQTGEEIWSDRYPMAGADGAARSFAGPRSSPAVANGKVLTIGVRGTVSCLDAQSGELLWRKDDFSAHPRFYTSSSPIIRGDLGITQLGGEEEGAIVAYELATGSERWRWTGEGTSYSSLAPVTTDDGQALILAETVRSVIALDASDGSQVWQMPFVVRGRGYNAATPIVHDGAVILAGSGRGTRAVTLAAPAEPQGEEEKTTNELWVNEDNSVMFNSPIQKGNLIYGIADDGELFCINADSGKTAWAVPTASPSSAEQPQDQQGQEGGRGRGRGSGGSRGATGYGSLVDAGDVLFALTPAGELIAFNHNPDQYAEVARYRVAEGGTFAYPIVSGHGFFIKDRDALTLWRIE